MSKTIEYVSKKDFIAYQKENNVWKSKLRKGLDKLEYLISKLIINASKSSSKKSSRKKNKKI